MIPVILVVLTIGGIWAGWAWQLWATFLIVAVIWEYLAS